MRWHAELSFIAAKRGYRSGWAAHKFKEKFGTWPAVRTIEPRDASAEVLSWVRSRNIAWIKRRQKSGAA
jgi:DNA repair protein RadD